MHLLQGYDESGEESPNDLSAAVHIDSLTESCSTEKSAAEETECSKAIANAHEAVLRVLEGTTFERYMQANKRDLLNPTEVTNSRDEIPITTTYKIRNTLSQSQVNELRAALKNVK